MQNKESSIPNDWFRKGNQDLKAAEILAREYNLGVAAFHIQQTVEKYLKGYLLSKGWKLRRIHDLVALLNEAILYNKKLEGFRSLCKEVAEYYIEERYPFIIESRLTKEEISSSLKDVKKLIKALTAEIEIKK